MPPPDLPTALLSPDADQVAAAIRAHTKHLGPTPSDPDRAAFATLLLPHAEHPSGKVRQAIAEASPLLPDAQCDPLLAALLVDVDHYVRNAAQRASKRRNSHKAAQAREHENDDVATSILDELTTKYSKAARRLAERAITRTTESFVRKLYHELSKILMTAQFQVIGIRSGLRAPDLDRDALDEKARVLQERLAFLGSVLESARASTATITPSLREERLAGLVDEARTQLLARLGARAEHLAFVNDVDPTLCIDADRHALLQAFQNILQNGAEAYDPGARIDLHVSATTRHAGSHIALAFTDKGTGMPDDRKQRPFVPFASTKPGGTGVGLLVTRRMVEEVHGGALAIHSTLGEGTTVTMTLPVRSRGARDR